MEDELIAVLLSGAGASLFTFILSAFFYNSQAKKERRENNRAYIDIQEILLSYNLKPIKEARVIETNDYNSFYDWAKASGQSVKTNYAEITNHGPGLILQAEIGIRLVVTEDSTQKQSWRVDVDIPLIKNGESIYIPLLHKDFLSKPFYIADCEITYLTQVNEKMRYIYRAKTIKNDELETSPTTKLQYRKWFMYFSIIKTLTSRSRWRSFYNK